MDRELEYCVRKYARLPSRWRLVVMPMKTAAVTSKLPHGTVNGAFEMISPVWVSTQYTKSG